MGGQKPEKTKKRICIGILAHVDAGKTTLSEGLLYLCGEIRKLGRVDHGDAFLDTYELERERGNYYIFQAGAAENRRDGDHASGYSGPCGFFCGNGAYLQVLDYAILVINGMDGVQSHTMTLWRLLERYEIPVFLFVNKMDQQGTDHDALLRDLRKRLNENCMDFACLTEDNSERAVGEINREYEIRNRHIRRPG